MLNVLAKSLHVLMRKRIMELLTPIRLSSQLGGFSFPTSPIRGAVRPDLRPPVRGQGIIPFHLVRGREGRLPLPYPGIGDGSGKPPRP